MESDKHLLELARYLPLNPVRAGLCRSAGDWLWSSYASTIGVRPQPSFLDPSAFLGMFGSVDAYAAWVAEGVDPAVLNEDGALQPPPQPSLATLLAEDTDLSIAVAHFRYGYSQAAIAKHLGVSRSQVSRRLARHD